MYGDEDAEERIALPRPPTITLTDDTATDDDDVAGGTMTGDEVVTGGTMTGDELGVGSLARLGVDMNASLTRGNRFTSRLSTAASNVSMISAT